MSGGAAERAQDRQRVLVGIEPPHPQQARVAVEAGFLLRRFLVTGLENSRSLDHFEDRQILPKHAGFDERPRLFPRREGNTGEASETPSVHGPAPSFGRLVGVVLGEESGAWNRLCQTPGLTRRCQPVHVDQIGRERRHFLFKRTRAPEKGWGPR